MKFMGNSGFHFNFVSLRIYDGLIVFHSLKEQQFILSETFASSSFAFLEFLFQNPLQICFWDYNSYEKKQNILG